MSTALICTLLYVLVAGLITWSLIKFDKGDWAE